MVRHIQRRVHGLDTKGTNIDHDPILDPMEHITEDAYLRLQAETQSVARIKPRGRFRPPRRLLLIPPPSSARQSSILPRAKRSFAESSHPSSSVVAGPRVHSLSASTTPGISPAPSRPPSPSQSTAMHAPASPPERPASRRRILPSTSAASESHETASTSAASTHAMASTYTSGPARPRTAPSASGQSKTRTASRGRRGRGKQIPGLLSWKLEGTSTQTLEGQHGPSPLSLGSTVTGSSFVMEPGSHAPHPYLSGPKGAWEQNQRQG